MSMYTTRDEAVMREIIEPLEASPEVADARAEFDVDAIADAVIGFEREEGKANGVFSCIVEPDEFWAIAMSHAR